jgi:hypothetical protein
MNSAANPQAIQTPEPGGQKNTGFHECTTVHLAGFAYF